jgi:hypothetical protein
MINVSWTVCCKYLVRFATLVVNMHCLVVVVRVLILSGWVFAKCSPRLASLGRVVWWGVRSLLGLYDHVGTPA